MHGQHIAFFACASAGIGAGIVPDVSAITSELPQLNVIAMGSFPGLEDEEEFVLGSIQ
jgi:hypothetical protein